MYKLLFKFKYFFTPVLFACIIFSTIGNSAVTNIVEKTPVILDVDMAPDDELAILYLLNQKKLDLLAITITGNGEVYCDRKNDYIPGAENVIRLIDFSRKANKNIQVACGATRSSKGNHAFPDQRRIEVSQPIHEKHVETFISTADRKKIIDSDAIDVIISILKKSTKKVKILVLGPLTNIDLALKKEPSIKNKIDSIVIMGGAIHVPGNLKDLDLNLAYNETAEWNIYIDPHAAETVFKSGIPIYLISLDATNQVPVTLPFLEKIKVNQKTHEAEFAEEFFHDEIQFIKEGTVYFWDPLAAVFLSHPNVCQTEIKRIRVHTKEDSESGRTYQDPQGSPIHVCTTVNREKFMSLFWSGLND